MFFKNLVVYQLTRKQVFASFDAELFAANPCTELAPGQLQTVGFVPLDEELSYLDTQDLLVFNIQQISRTVPASFIASELKKAKQIHMDQQLRPATKTEVDAMKDAIIERGLPRAFPKTTILTVMLNRHTQQLYLDTGSVNNAESVLAFIRKMLGSLPVVPLLPLQAVALNFTRWVKDQEDIAPFELGTSAKLVSLDKVLKSSFVDDDLANEEVLAGIDRNKLITQLALSWYSCVTFKLSDDFVFTGMKWDLDFKDSNEDIEDPLSKLDADAILVLNGISALLSNIGPLLGGYDEPEELKDVSHEEI